MEKSSHDGTLASILLLYPTHPNEQGWFFVDNPPTSGPSRHSGLVEATAASAALYYVYSRSSIKYISLSHSLTLTHSLSPSIYSHVCRAVYYSLGRCIPVADKRHIVYALATARHHTNPCANACSHLYCLS